MDGFQGESMREVRRVVLSFGISSFYFEKFNQLFFFKTSHTALTTLINTLTTRETKVNATTRSIPLLPLPYPMG
jgi:hypothetical protein